LEESLPTFAVPREDFSQFLAQCCAFDEEVRQVLLSNGFGGNGMSSIAEKVGSVKTTLWS
jgi:hypothetical protein